MQLKSFIKEIEKEAPLFLAENWDNPGLQIGNPEQEVKSILVALQVNNSVVEEAIAKGVDLIFTHHPFIFRPISHINFSDFTGSIIEKLIKNNISLYSAHTNLDSATYGINEQIANLFPAINKGILKTERKVPFKKISVYYPADNPQREEFIEKVLEKGNTYLGEYTKCGFYYPGTGCFEPTLDAHPHIGENAQFNQVPEIKLEFIVDPAYFYSTVEYIKNIHPYEEPLITAETLEQPLIYNYGIGRWVKLDRPYNWEEFIKFLKKTFNIPQLRYKKITDKQIEKVGLVGGVGIYYLQNAVSQKCDLYITSDIKHHDWDLAEIYGINLIEITHFKIEQKGLRLFFDYFKEKLLKYDEKIKIIYSEAEKENFSLI